MPRTRKRSVPVSRDGYDYRMGDGIEWSLTEAEVTAAADGMFEWPVMETLVDRRTSQVDVVGGEHWMGGEDV